MTAPLRPFYLLASITTALSLATAAQAAELNPAAVIYKTQDQFTWRDPSDKAGTNQTVLHGDPTKPGLYIYINKFKPGRFGTPHHHPNDRYITVIDGASWRGTGTVVDPNHATRVPKGSFSIDHALKVHWDGTKEESGAYLIAGNGPATQTEDPRTSGPYAGGDPTSLTIKTPDQIEWKKNGDNFVAVLAGDPKSTGIYVEMLRWPAGNHFSRPHSHPNDRYIYVLDGTWWVGTGNNFDPANLSVPMKAGTYVTHFGKQVHWDGAKDEDTTLLIIGEGPERNPQVPQAK